MQNGVLLNSRQACYWGKALGRSGVTCKGSTRKLLAEEFIDWGRLLVTKLWIYYSRLQGWGGIWFVLNPLGLLEEVIILVISLPLFFMIKVRLIMAWLGKPRWVLFMLAVFQGLIAPVLINLVKASLASIPLKALHCDYETQILPVRSFRFRWKMPGNVTYSVRQTPCREAWQ